MIDSKCTTGQGNHKTNFAVSVVGFVELLIDLILHLGNRIGLIQLQWINIEGKR